MEILGKSVENGQLAGVRQGRRRAATCGASGMKVEGDRGSSADLTARVNQSDGLSNTIEETRL